MIKGPVCDHKQFGLGIACAGEPLKGVKHSGDVIRFL